MGILSRLGLTRKGSLVDYLTGSSSTLGIVSPNSTATLAAFISQDVLGLDAEALPMTRDDAIAIPAVSKARNLLVSTICKFPLVALNTAGELAEQPTFLYRTDSLVDPYGRMAWTVDDMIFYGLSLWLVDRGASTQITNAEYCPFADWEIQDGAIVLRSGDEWRPALASEVILFNPPFDGLLNIATRTMRGARDTEKAWVSRMKNPIPLTELHMLDGDIEQDEAESYVDAWSAKHQADSPAIGLTPPSLELRVHGEVHADLFVEGRNALRTDIGSYLNIRTSMLDGTIGVDSLTYSTKTGERNSFYDIDLPFWTGPIEARLSMDDVVPRGQRVRFNQYEAFNAPRADTGEVVPD